MRNAAARRGRASWPVIGSLSGGTLLLLLLIAWLTGLLPGGRRGVDSSKQAHRQPVADLKIELASPIDRTADLGETSLKDTLAAVPDAVRSKANLLDDPAWLATIEPRVSWGDLRKPVEGGASPPRNWDIRFVKGDTKDKYAKQLDFFGIEIAVVKPDNKLIYVRNFSKSKPETHVGRADEEKRCYLTWREGDLSRADADLLARAGVSIDDRVVLKIIPPALEATLAELEKTYAGGDVDKVARTQFGIRATSDGFEFYVIEQYRKEQAKR
jgi:hypothetical protein